MNRVVSLDVDFANGIYPNPNPTDPAGYIVLANSTHQLLAGWQFFYYCMDYCAV